MAITKTYLGGDPAAVQAFLSSTGMFDTVTRSDNVITCKNADSVTVLTITKADAYTWTFTVSLTGSHSWEKTYDSHGLNYGYKCGKGAFLVLNYNAQDNLYSILITKNNDDKVSFVFPDSYENRNRVYSLTYADTYPVTYTRYRRPLRSRLFFPRSSQMHRQARLPIRRMRFICRSARMSEEAMRNLP